MAIAKRPVSYREYYKAMREAFTEKINVLNEEEHNLTIECNEKHKALLEKKDYYKTTYNIDLDKYSEFKENTYSSGLFYRDANNAFLNKKNDYELTSDLYELVSLAKLQKDLYIIDKKINLYTRCINVKLSEYNNILRTFYNEVHTQMIINGYGYSMDNNIGWIAINRVLLKNKTKILDYSKTKKKRQELINKGVRLYNKEEAEWCAKNGIEYNAEDPRVFRRDEYFYEVPLMGCKIKDNTHVKFEISDYRHSSYRGKTNEDLVKQCNNDTNQICKLNLDLRTKLNLCVDVNKILYTKFIRNETQESYAYSKVNRKNRQ